MFDFIVRRKINSAFKNNRRNRTFKNLESIKDVLILFTYNDWNEIQPIVRDLEQNGKNVVLWTTMPANIQQNKHASILPINVKVITKKEKNPLQILKQDIVSEYRRLSYDTLIDLTTKNSYTLKYLLVQNSSEFCIGISESSEKVYDYILLKEDDKSLHETYNQLKIYLDNMVSSTN